MREKLLAAVATVEKDTCYFKPVAQVKEKVLQNALNKYAKDCAPEDVVALMDTTFLNSGKDGYLLSTTHFYSNMEKAKLPLAQLRQVELTGKKKDHILLTCADGTATEVFGTIYTQYLYKAMRAVIAAVQQTAPAVEDVTAPKEYRVQPTMPTDGEMAEEQRRMAQTQEDDLAEERKQMAADIEATIKELQALLATLPAEKAEPDAAEQADAANAVAETAEEPAQQEVAEEPTVPEPEPVQQLETPAAPEEDKAATASKQEECTIVDTPDFKKFYEETMPTMKNIEELFQITKYDSNMNDKHIFRDASNKAFGMLAHLNFNADETKEIAVYFTPFFYNSLVYSLNRLHIAKSLIQREIDFTDEIQNSAFNPTAIPMIQRYRKMFDAYEKEHGLTPFYLQKKSK